MAEVECFGGIKLYDRDEGWYYRDMAACYAPARRTATVLRDVINRNGDVFPPPGSGAEN